MNEQVIDEQPAELVPISLIAAEIGETVGWVANHFGAAVTLDDLGLRSVAASVAREFFTDRREWKARQEEAHRRQAAEIERKYPKVRVAGVPAQDGLTAVESLTAAADDSYLTPSQEFGRPGQGGVRTELLEAELEKGRRAIEAKRRLTAERAKERAADQMKDDLGGRQ